MKKFIFFKNIFLIFALVIVVYLVANFSDSLKSKIFEMFNIPGSSVAGVSTKRAEEISGRIKSDIDGQLSTLQQQILNLTLSDAINGLSRLQKIPKDFNSLKNFTEEKINDVLR